jgi:hypothetical protein
VINSIGFASSKASTRSLHHTRHATLFTKRYPPSLVIIGDLGSPHAPLGLLRHIRLDERADKALQSQTMVGLRSIQPIAKDWTGTHNETWAAHGRE